MSQLSSAKQIAQDSDTGSKVFQSFACGFLIVVPIVAILTSRVDGHNLSRIAEIALTLIAAIWISLLAIQSNWLPVTKLELGAGISFLALAAISVTLSAYSVMAARELTILVGLASVIFAMARSAGSASSNAVLSGGVAAAAALYNVVVLVIYSVYVSHGELPDRFSLAIGYNHIRFLNHVQTVMLPLLLMATQMPFRQRAFKSSAWFGLSAGFAMLVYSEGRATMVALVISAVVCATLFRRDTFRLGRNLLRAGLFAAVIYTVLFIVIPAIGDLQPDPLRPDGIASPDSAYSRFLLWHTALADIQSSPWFGIGPMHYAHHRLIEAAHPHNVYLMVAAEWGVPMLLLLVSVSGWGMWRLARAIRNCGDARQRDVGMILLVALIAAAVDGCLSGNFVMPVPQVWIAVTIGWAIGWTRAHSASPALAASINVPRWVRFFVATALCASQIWLVVSIWPEARNLGAYLERINRDVSHGTPSAPRFWSNGWF